MLISETKYKRRGFTLIELLITMAIVGLLLMAAIPSMREWMNNLRIRAVAEGLLDGLQLARNEAIKRNVPIQFSLQTGTGWQITVFTSGAVLQTRPNAEESGNISVAVANSAASVTFDGFGRLWVPTVASNFVVPAPMDQIDIRNTNFAAADQRALRILIASPGGQVRMCDPAVVTAGDPRRC